MKTCKRCEIEQPLDEFRTSHGGKYRRHVCRSCERAYARKWKRENPDKLKSYSELSEDAKERRRARCREYKAENKRLVSQHRKSYYEANRDKELIRGREYKRSWYKANKKEIIRKSIEYKRKRYREDPDFATCCTMRWMLKRVLARLGHEKTGRTHEELGYSATMLRLRIETNFRKGMSWGNYGEWHIDHTIPIAHFVAKGESRPSVINALCNLRPMWAHENMSKGARHPFREAPATEGQPIANAARSCH